MDIGALSFGLGAVLLLAGLVGGKVQALQFHLEGLSGPVRIVAIALGLGFIVLGFVAPAISIWFDSSVAKAAMSPIDRGIDRPRSDIGPPIRVATPEQCQDACRENDECKAWAHFTEGKNKRCWLKRQVPTPIEKGHSASGVKCT